ncbi:MAG: DNA-binding beta-propeller fold protein YncE [Desulforhopalus sp.]|jgi:DNA-binding beta-propeller fold protein YncE
MIISESNSWFAVTLSVLCGDYSHSFFFDGSTMIKKYFPLKSSVPFLIFLIGFGLFCCTGCTTSVRQLPPPLVELVWPTGEEIPRILYLGSIERPEDINLGPNLFQRFWGYLVGKNDVRLVAPYGLTVDAAGRIYIVDTFSQKIHLFDVAAGKFQVFPEGDGALSSPIDIVVDDSSGRIYVADSKDGIVKVFDTPDDKAPLTIGEGLLQRPTGLAINRITEELLVVDTKLFSVFCFDLKTHQLKKRFGEAGVQQGRFNHPTNISVTRDGTILITDALNFRIQIFSATGLFQGTFGSVGDSPGHFARPRGLASDSDGNIYVVDALFDNIQIFDNRGRLLMAFGSTGQKYGQFWLPAGIFIDRDDKIYVADSYNKRIQIFQYLKQDDSLP